MQGKIVWQKNSPNPENTENFTRIQQWWESLTDQEVTFAQRLLPETENPYDLDWTPQRFDERFKIQSPRIGGITLYWQQPNNDQERSITARKLEYNTTNQELFIFSQAQQQVVLRVAIPGIHYDAVKVKNPQMAGTQQGENQILLLRDASQKVEIELTLSPAQVDKLKEILG
ncbi:hypothetical protein PN462_20225 [Spirulina sp. CS-785/01]|uniref:hypothetical protein n=1 Tax=Spirulina sp. CS-785/01 TaxID=3021716 RepID=UPI002330FF2D|nr:hypothetical protein [Spirulina sp. CS-785/01]MDB9315452.1 hypothetical protein [Spirulina sp. CS-785/01]